MCTPATARGIKCALAENFQGDVLEKCHPDFGPRLHGLRDDSRPNRRAARRESLSNGQQHTRRAGQPIERVERGPGARTRCRFQIGTQPPARRQAVKFSAVDGLDAMTWRGPGRRDTVILARALGKTSTAACARRAPEHNYLTIRSNHDSPRVRTLPGPNA